ncbi:hypothetical protein SAMN05660242_2791 [Thermoanaerobacterium sp. RBIITD]|nr:hypothetical protein SAMN05660242_2791 [Thermoanaerobacterium sp. RBIITD]
MEKLMDFRKFINNLYKYKSLSIIGLEKNTGKTTTLNFLINKFKNKKLGITSIGRDGEERDVVTYTNKPKIYVNENTVVATSKSSFLKSDATFEILDVMDINTPLGNIIIGRSVHPGFVEIAGTSTKSQTIKVINKLSEYGCEFIIIDGALSRKTFADPKITEASILCTGAAFSEDIDMLTEETYNTLKLLSIDKAEKDIVQLYKENMKDCKIAFLYGNEVKKSNLKTSINASKEIILNFNDYLKFVFIKGILTDNLIRDMLNAKLNLKSVTFVVEDGTKLFIDKNNFETFMAKGGKIRVVNNINIIGVSVNPVSPSGCVLDYNELWRKLKRKIDIPVFNVMDYDLDVME